MKAVIQRATEARVWVDGAIVGEIGPGLVVLVAAGREDTPDSAARMADRIWGMRIFNDLQGKMNLTLRDCESLEPAIGSERSNVLVVSNFTIYGDTTQRRPSFGASASFDQGRELYEVLVESLNQIGARVATGVFGADMSVEIVNDGPVTLIAEV